MSLLQTLILLAAGVLVLVVIHWSEIAGFFEWLNADEDDL